MTSGTAKTCRPQIADITALKNTAGEIIGSVTFHRRRTAVMPSRSAASYRDSGTSRRAAVRMTTAAPDDAHAQGHGGGQRAARFAEPVRAVDAEPGQERVEQAVLPVVEPEPADGGRDDGDERREKDDGTGKAGAAETLLQENGDED